MIKFEETDIYGWEAAIRGMRNPMNSWDKSDSGWKSSISQIEMCGDVNRYGHADIPTSKYIPVFDDGEYSYNIGPNDQKLMMQLAANGPVHAKYRRMITVTVDITAPLYWWKEFDTYKVGTVANSCSTMHKITNKKFELSDFSAEHLVPDSYKCLGFTIRTLNKFRDCYISYDKMKNKDVPVTNEIETILDKYSKKDIWWQMIQLLPSSYNQKRTVMMNYEVLSNIYNYRKDHKLDEWHTFCNWIKTLPYSELIIGGTK